MTALLIEFEPSRTRFLLDDGGRFEAPCGAASLMTDELHGDPPRPEELTNAIGAMLDHLDDVLRELPHVVGADVSFAGETPVAIAAVEAGAAPTLPMTISREAIEDVFRTLATERIADRRRNPGLDERLVATVVGGCCIAVAIMRRLHLDTVTVTR